MSLLSTSSSGVALIKSVTISVQCPKMSNKRFFFLPSTSLPPSASLWNAYLQRQCHIRTVFRDVKGYLACSRITARPYEIYIVGLCPTVITARSFTLP